MSIYIDVCELAALLPAASSHSVNASRQQQTHAKQAALKQHLLARLSKLLNTTITAADIARTEQGKPYLLKHSLHFNYSHSHSFYAFAHANALEIGVDIEDRKRIVRFAELAEYAFHPEEISTWQQHGADYWLQVWTIKEAIVKAAGCGIRLDLSQLNTQHQYGQTFGRCQTPLGEFSYYSATQANYLLAVAWAGNSRPAIGFSR